MLDGDQFNKMWGDDKAPKGPAEREEADLRKGILHSKDELQAMPMLLEEDEILYLLSLTGEETDTLFEADKYYNPGGHPTRLSSLMRLVSDIIVEHLEKEGTEGVPCPVPGHPPGCSVTIDALKSHLVELQVAVRAFDYLRIMAGKRWLEAARESSEGVEVTGVNLLSSEDLDAIEDSVNVLLKKYRKVENDDRE